MDKLSFPNRRKFHRIHFDGKANVEIGGQSYDCCQVKNLCLTGMCVAGEFEPPRQGSCLISFIREENSEKVYMRVAGRIVWSNDNGFGIEFKSMHPDHYQVLMSVLINNAELPAIILSEIPRQCPFELEGM